MFLTERLHVLTLKSVNERHWGKGLREEFENLFDYPALAEWSDVNPSDREIRAAIFDAHKGRDFWTQQPISVERMHLDHVIPKSLSGPNHVLNLVPTSQINNSRKHNKCELQTLLPVIAYIRNTFAERLARNLEDQKKKRLSQRPARRRWEPVCGYLRFFYTGSGPNAEFRDEYIDLIPVFNQRATTTVTVSRAHPLDSFTPSFELGLVQLSNDNMVREQTSLCSGIWRQSYGDEYDANITYANTYMLPWMRRSEVYLMGIDELFGLTSEEGTFVDPVKLQAVNPLPVTSIDPETVKEFLA